MNRVIIGLISMFAGAIIVYKNDNIIIKELMDENKTLTDIVERLKYENNKMDKLLKKNFLKESFDILKYNMCIKKPKTTDDEILIKYDSSDSDSDSNSFQDFNQINELSESLNSELESLNSDDDSSKSKIDPSLSNLV
tara:strand:- start:216 stop:629 length:414 start_codon:yes stop_codon:yes gene_type:complete